MKKNKYYILLAVCVLFGCENNVRLDNGPDKNKNTQNSFWSLTSRDDLLVKRATNYDNYYTETDFVVAIQSQKTDPLQKEKIASYNGIHNLYNGTRSGIINSKFIVKANGMLLGEQEHTRSSSVTNSLSSLYGKDVSFTFTYATTRNADNDTTINMYIPELVEITSPKIVQEKELYPLCYYKNFVLNWNVDENNQNGVVVVVEWIGGMAFGKDHPNIYIRRTDIIDDTGSAILNNALFDDIPDTALVFITVLRGGIENVLVDGYSYKLVGESHAVLPIILIKNIKNK